MQNRHKKGFAFMDSPAMTRHCYRPDCQRLQSRSLYHWARLCLWLKTLSMHQNATNTEMYERLIDDMDINAGAMLTEGLTLEEKGREIYQLLLMWPLAGNQPKQLGDYEFVPWQIGAVM